MGRHRTGIVLVAVLMTLGCGGGTSPSPGPSAAGPSAGKVAFLSSQGQPANEVEAITGRVLPGFNGSVDFNSQLTGTAIQLKVLGEHAQGTASVDVIALTHGDMPTLLQAGALSDLTPLAQRLQKDRSFNPTMLKYGRLGTAQQYYIPWLHATYMMVVNKKALAYLPRGVDRNNLTYDQLIAWGQAIQKATGSRMIGLPAAPGSQAGLIQRFLQGYVYPSYTGGEVTGFKSPAAVQMWQMLRRLWAVSSPQSTTYSYMQDPLQGGEVWIAWDHQARLIDALTKYPDQFVAVPAPSGPKGQGWMSAVVGLGIPKGAPNVAGAQALIDYLTTPKVQAATAGIIGFFPAVEGVKLSGADAPPALAAEAAVAQQYTANPKGVPALLPVGLGKQSDQLNKVYQDTFNRILLRSESIQTVLDDEGAQLQRLLDQAAAPCWPPDPPSTGTCRIT